MRRLLCLAAWLAALAIVVVAAAGRARGEQPVDVALVLAVDISISVSDEEWQLQRDGIADAIGSDVFARAVGAGHHGRIAVALMQWAWHPHTAIGWRIIASPAAARALADEIRAMPRATKGWTCVARMLAGATVLLEPWRNLAARRVIDVSGDGANNCKTEIDDVPAARAAALATGLTINGLPIISTEDPKVDEWYEAALIGGPGAFVVVAEGFGAFRDAFLRKLVIEVAEAPDGR